MSEKKKGQKTIALLELGGSHAECLHTQIHYLTQKGYSVHLICDKIVWSQIEGKDLLAGVQLHNTLNKNVLKQFVSALKVHFYIRKHKISHLVVNTSEINAVRNLFLIPFPKKINCTGIVHNAQKLVSGRNLNRIVGKKMKKFFVLSEYLRRNFQPQTNFNLEVFYPVYFPEFEYTPLEKKPDEIWITIPGAVLPGRRDYVGLLNKLMTEKLHPNSKLILLGHLDVVKYPEIDELLHQTNLEGVQIIVFPHFIENKTFHSYIAQSDLILPLMHPSEKGKSDFYGDHRISGSFNLSFAYKIPMLMEESMKPWDDLKNNTFFYKAEEIIRTINAFIERKQEITDMQEAMRCEPKWKEERLMKTYIDFVEL